MIKQIGSMDVSSRDAIPLDWELRSCQNQACPHDTWVVKRAPIFSNVWWVAPRPNQSLVLVAGRDPLCPHCRTPLAAVLELPSAGQAAAIQVGAASVAS
jgi:hypothetical protein